MLMRLAKIIFARRRSGAPVGRANGAGIGVTRRVRRPTGKRPMHPPPNNNTRLFAAQTSVRYICFHAQRLTERSR